MIAGCGFSTPSGWNRNNVLVLFNRTVKLYTASCKAEGYGADMMYYKALYLADQLYLKFGSWLFENPDAVPVRIDLKYQNSFGQNC